MKHAVVVAVMLCFFSVQPSFSNQHEEIEYLLSLVAESHCTFIRNGKEYSGKEASEHLYKKFIYAKSKIKKTTDFIEKVASHSSITKKPYWVRCQNRKQLSRDWFTKSLTDYKKR